MNEIVKAQTNDINAIAAAIANEAMTDATFFKMLKFKHGDYWCDNEQIPLGTEMLAHCASWVKLWVHFEHRRVVEKRFYRFSRQEKAPQRDEIPDNDPATWPPGLDGRPADPWVYQFQLPLEDNNGEVRIFTTGSWGGRSAVADLCTTWARRAGRISPDLPIIKLGKALMPTKNFGEVPRPQFDIVRWENRGAIVEVDQDTIDVAKEDELNDSIPF